MYKVLIYFSVVFLSACQSNDLSSKRITTYVGNEYSGKSEISLGDSFQNSSNRIRAVTLPKLKEISKGDLIRLYVAGYSNNINGTHDSLPLGGRSGNPVPSHAAFTVFKGSGFKVIPRENCPPKSTANDFLIKTSISSYDEDIYFQRSGWEATADESSGTGAYDTSNWFSRSKLVLLTQMIRCSDKYLKSSNYLPLTLASMNEANSFLLFNKSLGIYFTDSISQRSSVQLDRDKASTLSILKIAAEFAGLSMSEFELAISGVTLNYDYQTGILNTLYLDPAFDPTLAKFIFISEYFGIEEPEITEVPFGEKIELKLRLSHKTPTFETGVRKLDVELVYRNEILYQKSLI